MKKVKFNELVDVKIIKNREQIKEKERFYMYYLILYIIFFVGSIIYLFQENYPVSFALVIMACVIYIISNIENIIYYLGCNHSFFRSVETFLRVAGFDQINDAKPWLSFPSEGEPSASLVGAYAKTFDPYSLSFIPEEIFLLFT